jgi:drug/metabolite transporter (DMT)-like permease
VLDPFVLASLRYGVGVLLFVVILWLIEGREALRYGGRFPRAVVAGLFGFVGFNVLVWWGLVHTHPEHASLIMTLQTPLTALVVWLLHALRPSRFTMGCMAVAFAGVALVITKGDPAAMLQGGSLVGDLLVLGGALSWLVYTLMGQGFGGWSPLRMTVLTCIPGTIGLIAVNALTIAAGWSQMPSMEQILSVKWQLAYFIVFTVVLGVLSFNNAVRHAGPLNTMLTLNLIPVAVFAIEAGLGRTYSAIELGGAAIVIAALVANNFHIRRRQTSAPS